MTPVDYPLHSFIPSFPAEHPQVYSAFDTQFADLVWLRLRAQENSTVQRLQAELDSLQETSKGSGEFQSSGGALDNDRVILFEHCVIA